MFEEEEGKQNIDRFTVVYRKVPSSSILYPRGLEVLVGVPGSICTMACGCKKTVCQNKICKCRKANTYCTDECACGIACKNKENPQQNGHAASSSSSSSSPVGHLQNPQQNGHAASSSSSSPVQHGSWEGIRELIQEEDKLVFAMSKLHVVPPAVQDIIKRKKADVEQMRKLLQLMEEMGPAHKEVLSADEWEAFCNKLKPCSVCHRKFNPARIKKHQEICIRRSSAQ